VTKKWLEAFVLGLTLNCHSSFRGVLELLADHFGLSLSLGTVHNIHARAIAQAQTINQSMDLSSIHYAAPDEIFQNGRPVLVGVDLQSTYCFLLEAVEHRDADTWALELLTLQEQGLKLEYSVADGGTGIRAGQKLACPEVPCHYDHFHALSDVKKLTTYLLNRAYGCIRTSAGLEKKLSGKRKCKDEPAVRDALEQARQAERVAINLADDVETMLHWLREDVLAPRGPDYAPRLKLLDWIVEELSKREPLCAHRIAPVRRMLQNNRTELLAYIERLDRQLSELSFEFKVLADDVRAVWNLEQLNPGSSQYSLEAEALRCRLGHKFCGLEQAIIDLKSVTFRSSSWVENINSRLRNYFFLRKQIGPEYLDLLQFYLNHHRYQRSQVPSRTGKSPAELLTGTKHPHWLELLGYAPFSRN